MYKKIRYYYWLLAGFFKKNLKQLIISFVIGFFLLTLYFTFFPYITTLFQSRSQKIGIVGQYQLSNLPDDIKAELSNALLTISPKGEIIPILIKSYELRDDNKTYRFYLKPNLVWANGDIFASRDINYNFKSVEQKIIDDTTIEFRLNQPLSTFPAYLTKPLFKDTLVGIAGLYELGEYRMKAGVLVSMKLSQNKKNLPFKTYLFYDTENKLINAYKRGEINLFKTNKKNLADTFSGWKNTRVTQTVNYNQILTLFFNTERELLSQKDIRQALVYALPELDRFGVRAAGPISPLSWAYSARLKQYTSDQDRGTALFKKMTEGEKKPEINFYTFYDYLTIAEDIKKNYEKMGLTVNLKVLSYLPEDFDLLLTVWNPPADPDQYYFWHSTQKAGNITRYKNVKIDKLLEDGRKTVNVGERKKIYADFQKNMTEDLPAHFIYYPYVYTVEKK